MDTRALLSHVLKKPEIETLRALLAPEIYLVGGAVRDALLSVDSQDLDIASALSPEEIQRRCEKAEIRVIPTGLKHQTVTALIPPSLLPVEITTFRGPNMQPAGGVVHGASIEEDLRYRDFTVNAFAVNLESHEFLDPHAGLHDLRSKILRAVGSAKDRFKEDPLRMMRAIRIACGLHFTIEATTAAAIKACASLLTSVSIERIREEFSKILVSSEPRAGLMQLLDSGLLEIVLPEIMPSVGCEQNEWHSADVFLHTIDVIERTPQDLELRLSALFHDIGKPASLSIDPETGTRHFFRHESIGAEITQSALERLRFSHDTISAVETLVRTHMRPLEAGTGGLRRILRDTGEHFAKWRSLKEADAGATKVEESVLAAQFLCFDAQIAEILKGPQLSPLSSLAVRGNDIMAAGITEGPMIGKVLRALHEKVLDNPELNSKEKLLELVANMDLQLL